jgi:hypothetical protein
VTVNYLFILILVSSGNLESDVNLNLDFLEVKEKHENDEFKIHDLSKQTEDGCTGVGDLEVSENNPKVGSSLFINPNLKNSAHQISATNPRNNFMPNNLQFSQNRTFVNNNLNSLNPQENNFYNFGQSNLNFKKT